MPGFEFETDFAYWMRIYPRYVVPNYIYVSILWEKFAPRNDKSIYRKEEFAFSDINYDDDLKTKSTMVEKDVASVELCARYLISNDQLAHIKYN